MAEHDSCCAHRLLLLAQHTTPSVLTAHLQAFANITSSLLTSRLWAGALDTTVSCDFVTVVQDTLYQVDPGFLGGDRILDLFGNSIDAGLFGRGREAHHASQTAPHPLSTTTARVSASSQTRAWPAVRFYLL